MRHALLLVILLLAGCQTPTVAPLPAYGDLVARHNERVKNIERFWSRAVIELRWVDDAGKSRFEQGEGHLILDLPKHSALALGKVGQIKLWAGSNDTHYWLFDELNDRTLYLGRHDGQSDNLPGAKQPSPLPVRPIDLPRLLAILPIDTAAPATVALTSTSATAAPTVTEADGLYIITPPAGGTRYHFHPIYQRVMRVDLLDDKGDILLTSRLGRKQDVTDADATTERILDENGYPSGPFIDSRFEVTTPGKQGSMTLHLFGMTDDKDRINPNAFNLDRLIKTEFKPQRIVPIATQ